MKDKVRHTITKEELRNGWTQQSLDKYLQEREEQKASFEMKKKHAVQVRNVSTYDPLKWGM